MFSRGGALERPPGFLTLRVLRDLHGERLLDVRSVVGLGEGSAFLAENGRARIEGAGVACPRRPPARDDFVIGM